MQDYYREWSLNENEFALKLTGICQTYDITNTNAIQYYSQQDEDKYVIQYLLNKKIDDGVFLEVGACDGILYSNTKTLEDYFGFSGILIEPQQDFFEKLIVNRPNCECYNAAISTEETSFIEFFQNGAEGGIAKTLNTTPEKGKKVFGTSLAGLRQMASKKKHVKVQNKKLSEILSASKFSYIDLMFIDVEGGELALLQSIDFSFPIYCIIIEAHSDQHEKNQLVRNYLLQQGFSFKERQRGNEVWVNKNYFRKHLFSF